jgi:predicted ATPase
MPRVDLGDVTERGQELTGRLWVLDEVADWLERGREQCFLLTGEPGSGKTVLAAWLAGAGAAPDDAGARERLERIRDAWRAAHFCVAENQRGSVDPVHFSQHLARQLTDRYDEYGQAILTRIAPEIRIEQVVQENRGALIGLKVDQFVAGVRAEEVYNRLVRDPLNDLAWRRPNERIFILVDALDEALTVEGQNIVTLLAGSGDLSNARFLLTCRSNEARVVSLFRDARRLDISSSERKDLAEADVRAYVTARLERDAIWQQQTTAPERDELQNLLVRQADGNFLYARFVLDEVSARRRSPRNLAGLPLGLYELYREYLDRLIPEMRSYGSSQAWGDRFKPLLGCLSVATPAAPLAELPRWLNRARGDVVSGLRDVSQLTEELIGADESDENGYRLYHRSMADFLAADSYQSKGSSVLNAYFAPPEEEHERITHYYLTEFSQDWPACDAYGLRHLIGHLQARLALEPDRTKRRQRAHDLYRAALDPSFRSAQVEGLGNPHVALADARTTLQIALKRDDLVAALGCVGAYRSLVRGAGTATSIFAAVDAGDYRRAIRFVELGEREPDWARALYLYLAWEAAEAGDVATAQAAVEVADRIPELQAGSLSNALLACVARALAAHSGGAADPREWLVRWNRAADPLLRDHAPWQPLNQTERAAILDELNRVLSRLEDEARGGGDEFSSAVPFLSDEEAVTQAVGLQRLLEKVAGDPDGLLQLDRAIDLFLTNPYPRYRDIALVALSVATTAAPEANLALGRLRRIIQTGLNREGVTFTFDLPCVLLAEAVRRGLPAAPLADYVGRARDQYDRWGTAARIRSSLAAAAFRQGQKDQAVAQLREAETYLDGYAGYTSVAALALANRWREFGCAWGIETERLWNTAGSRAVMVRDATFRADRLELVRQYQAWSRTVPGDADAALKAVSDLVDHDARSVYVDYMSACWAAMDGPDANRRMAALVPLALVDGTRLDAVLARLLGPRLAALSDAELAEAIRVCAEHLTTGRPWDVGPAVGSFA